MQSESVKTFVEQHVLKNKNTAELKESDDWLANGLVDSLGIMKIVTFVEEELKTSIPEADVTVDNFKSLKDVAQYLEKRKLERSKSA